MMGATTAMEVVSYKAILYMHLSAVGLCVMCHVSRVMYVQYSAGGVWALGNKRLLLSY